MLWSGRRGYEVASFLSLVDPITTALSQNDMEPRQASAEGPMTTSTCHFATGLLPSKSHMPAQVHIYLACLSAAATPALGFYLLPLHTPHLSTFTTPLC